MSRLISSVITPCTLALALLAGTASAEQIYRSIDADGNVTFSSQPPADAVDVDEVSLPPGPSAEEQAAARKRVQAQEATASEIGEARASRAPKPPETSPAAPAAVEPMEPLNQNYGYPNRTRPVRDKLPERPVQLPARPARPVQLPARPVPR